MSQLSPLIPIVYFAILYLWLVNRWWILTFLRSGKQKFKTTDLTDEKLLGFIHKKTGLRLQKIYLMETDRAWGMMAGGLLWPRMYIARQAYETFSRDELEWLILHEAGHHVLQHSLLIVLTQLGLLAIGIAILLQFSYDPSHYLSVPLGVGLAIVCIQLLRRNEYAANRFALQRMTNPMAVQTIRQKAKEKWAEKRIPLESVRQKLFNIWTFQIYDDLWKSAQTIARRT